MKRETEKRKNKEDLKKLLLTIASQCEDCDFCPLEDYQDVCPLGHMSSYDIRRIFNGT